MKQKKIIQVITLVAIAIVFLGAGFALGRSGQSKEAAGDTVKVQESQYGAEAKEEKTSKKAGTRSVAVVNLDNGVEQNGSNINYAASLIQFPNNDFSYTSLEEARTGITSGTYAAYVIIPSAFSANIQSLNTTMTKSGITYELNQNLPEEDKLAALKQLNSFIQGMSDHVSILYMSGVMKEFHGAQDSALTVMANDKEDVDAISVISPHDLEKYVRFPQLAQPDMKVSALDIQGYITQNGELLERIRSEYEYVEEKGEEDKKELTAQGSAVSELFATTNDEIQNFDVTKGKDGNNVYDKGLNTVESTLQDYNEGIEESKNNIQKDVGDAEAELKTIESCWYGTKEGIRKYREGEDAEMNDAVNKLASILSSGIYEGTIEGSAPAYSVNDPGTGSITMDGTVYYIWDMATESLNEEGIESFLIDYTDALALTYTGTYSIGDEENKVPINNVDNIRSLINESILPTYDPSRFIKNPDENYTEGNSSKNNADVDDAFISIKSKLSFDTSADSGYKIDTVNSAEILDTVNKDIVAPLLRKTKKLKTEATANYNISAGELENFRNNVEVFNPLKYLDRGAIQSSYADMQSNGSDMQKTITERDASQSETLSNTYTTYAENQTKLQDNVKSATKASNEAVAEGLSGAKSVKVNNSAENQLLLQAFTQKLPYTRIGTLENTMAAEFIISPLYVSEEASAVDQAQADTQEKAAASVGAVSAVDDEKDDESNSSKAVPTLVVLLGVLLLGAAIGKTLSNRGAKDKNSTDIK
ncbi:hypothetical protein [Muricomes intestini]|uniref:Uncharacterized protein n=3 Tax=Muricomes intestini TaxID=1796634 RepID=A0A4R3K3T1_9FIRM|nr:hypothetical protein [Muricomes intestini]TCS77301.1 hypothetical protein EDD59_11830 [Muricomes intestini]HAX53403.1 hypothetical protein [Lachnospiraceae bacterium]